MTSEMQEITTLNFGLSGRLFDRETYEYIGTFSSLVDTMMNNPELGKRIKNELVRPEYSTGYISRNGHPLFEGDIVEIGDTGTYHLIFSKDREGTSFLFDAKTEHTNDPLERINITILEKAQEMANQNTLPKVRCRRLKDIHKDLRFVANIHYLLSAEGYTIKPGLDTNLSLFEQDKKDHSDLIIRWNEVLLYLHRKRKYILGPNLL